MNLLFASAGLAAGSIGAATLGRLCEHRRAPRALSDLLGWGFLVGEGAVLTFEAVRDGRKRRFHSRNFHLWNRGARQ